MIVTWKVIKQKLLLFAKLRYQITDYLLLFITLQRNKANFHYLDS
jgi:hypothetical protein